MRSSVTLRLTIFAAALTLLAALIGWSAFKSWKDIGNLRRTFTTTQIKSFRIADQLRSRVLQLNSHLLKYQTGHASEEWRNFDSESQLLSDWIHQQKTALTTPKERALLDQIDTAYDSFLGAARTLAAGAGSPRQFAGVEAASQRLLGLGLDLAEAHHETLNRFVAATQSTLTWLQGVIFAALLMLFALALWTATVVYHEMLSPLRAKLIESEALIERHEKLASLGVLAAGVAHEIRNPLTAIKARLFTQMKALAHASRERADAEFIGREIDRLDKIVGEFLRFARPGEPVLAPVSPKDLLHEVRELMVPQCQLSSIDLVIDRATETTISADREQLKQVLINLVRNAAEALKEGNRIVLRALDARMTLGGRVQPVITLEVEDSGPGIAPDVQARLFDPFFTTKPTGTGLGLSIAARIVEKHGGALRYQTAPGRGTTFGVILPAHP